MGRISALLIVLLPIIMVSISVPLSLLRLYSPSNNPYVSIVFIIPNYAFIILFLVAMNGLAKYYGDPKIFKNCLYAFIIGITTGITSFIIMYNFVTPILDQLSTYINSSGNVPPLSVLLSLLQVAAFIWLAVSIVAILGGFLYRRAFYALAEKSGERNFRQAGLFMLVGGILMIVFVGALLVFIGWIFAVLGFFSMKPKASQASADKDLVQPTIFT
jgi:uncharacterized membrane protein